MTTTRICPICGAEYVPNAPRQKYCSEACRRAGASAVRASWIRKSGHREKDKLRHRERREKERQAKNRLSAEFKARQEAETAFRLEQSRIDFDRRCSAGDIHALMIQSKTTGGNVSRRYWELFQMCRIEEIEASGIIEDTSVNGCSVYSDSFVDDVVQSIRETGHIVTETIKQGRK